MTETPFRDIARLLRTLEKLGLSHALIGGWAVIAWGFARASEDIDMLVELPPSRRKELLKHLSEHYEADWRPPGNDDPVAGLVRLTPRSANGFPADLLVMRGAQDRAAAARAAVIVAEGVKIPVVRPEDLIAMKLEAGGGQDYEDVRRLLSLLAGKLDEKLLGDSCRARKVQDRLALLRRG